MFKSVLSLVLGTLAFAVLGLTPAAASVWEPYTETEFTAAQEAGSNIVIDVFAGWCPTCRAQAPILDKLADDPALADARLFRLDFDTDKTFLSTHKIPRQSTILVFQGKKETARSVAETNAGKLKAAILSGL